jgi:nuclear pore complex protein Nup107
MNVDADLYKSCAEVLALCQEDKDDLDALLDAETGFAPRMRALCLEQCVFCWCIPF